MLSLRRFLLVLAVAVLLIAGCSGGSDGGNIPSSATPAPAATQAAPATPFTQEQFTELGMADVDGYVRQDPPLITASRMAVLYEPEESNTGFSVVVTIAHCTPDSCADISTAPDEPALRAEIRETHRNDPDLIFDYGAIEAAPGYEAFYTYARSFIQDGSFTSTLNAYRLTYHDGTNSIAIQVTPGRLVSMPRTVEALEMQLSQSQGETAARVFFAAFAHGFRPSP